MTSTGPGTVAALEYLSNAGRSGRNESQVLLLVRTDRNLSRMISSGGREAFSDAPDTAQREGVIAREQAIDIPMLMLFRQNGSKELGWRGTPFYWPVIWGSEERPNSSVFACDSVTLASGNHAKMRRAAGVSCRLATPPPSPIVVRTAASSSYHAGHGRERNRPDRARRRAVCDGLRRLTGATNVRRTTSWLGRFWLRDDR